MKIISAFVGTVAIRMSNDDAGPHRGVLQRDLVEFVGNLYKFSVRPTINPGMPAELTPILQFQSGEFISESGKIPVMQIIITSDGDVVVAQNTDLADAVMTDYLAQLDSGLGYRFAEAKPKRLYNSTLIVEFDSAFVEKSSTIRSIGGVINETIGSVANKYMLKRIEYGPETSITGQVFGSIEQLIPPDFLIERRAGEPVERNRFFCRAPLTTSEHARVLESVERAAIGVV